MRIKRASNISLTGLICGLGLCLAAFADDTDEIKFAGKTLSVARWVQVLNESPDDTARNKALAALAHGGTKSKSAILAILRVVTDGPLHTRASAIRALGSIQPDHPDADEAVTKAFQDNSIPTKQAAVLFFEGKKSATPAAQKAIIECLCDDRMKYALGLQCDIVRTLGVIPFNNQTLAALAATVDRNDTLVIDIALKSLSKAGKEAVPDLIRILDTNPRSLGAFKAIAAIGPEARPALPALAKCLKRNPDAYSRPLLIQAIAALGPLDYDEEVARGVLVWSDENGKWSNNAEAANKEAAARSRGERSFGLSSENPDKRATRILIGMGARRVVPLLTDNLRDAPKTLDDEIMVLQSVKMLGELGQDAKPAIAQLKKLAKSETRVKEVTRVTAIKTLARLKDPSSGELLEELARARTKNSGWDGSGARPSAFGAYGDLALPALKICLQSDNELDRLSAVVGLESAGKNGSRSAAAEVLVSALTDKNALVRASACTVLGEFGPSAKLAIAALDRLIDIELDPRVEAAAITAKRRVNSE